MTTIAGRPPHVFGRARPSQGGQHPIHHAPERDTHFRDLPPPTGSAPFHLDLKSILADAQYQAITPTLITGRYYTVPRPQEPYSTGNQLIDYFEFDWRKTRYVSNTL
jgi:hypothetical protein